MENVGTGALHPDIARVSSEIADTLTQWEALCSGTSAQASAVVHDQPLNVQASVGVHGQQLTNAQFNWSPEPGRWSIAQNLAHLNVVDGLDVAPITQVVADARARSLTSPGPFTYSWLNNYFIRSMEPPVKQKFKAPKAYVPPPDAPLAATLGGYRRIATALRDQVLLANGLDLKRVKTIMPALRFLKMPLGARFALICAHDRRHLWQARDIRNHANFPA